MAKKKTIDKEEVKTAEVLDKEDLQDKNEKEVEAQVSGSANTTEESDKLEEVLSAKQTKAKQTKKTDSKVKKDLEKAGEKNKELQDKYLRLSAEFDNYRKRTLNEKMDLLKNAGAEVLKDLLPVVDDFERAVSNIGNAKDIEAIKEGMDLISNKFKDFLSQKGLKEIEAMHLDFDMDKHEAITKIPVEDKKLKGKIVDVIEKGYVLNDKIIRYSKVVIGE